MRADSARLQFRAWICSTLIVTHSLAAAPREQEDQHHKHSKEQVFSVALPDVRLDLRACGGKLRRD